MPDNAEPRPATADPATDKTGREELRACECSDTVEPWRELAEERLAVAKELAAALHPPGTGLPREGQAAIARFDALAAGTEGSE